MCKSMCACTAMLHAQPPGCAGTSTSTPAHADHLRPRGGATARPVRGDTIVRRRRVPQLLVAGARGREDAAARLSLPWAGRRSRMSRPAQQPDAEAANTAAVAVDLPSARVPRRATAALRVVMSSAAPLSAVPRPVDLRLAAARSSVAAMRPLQPLGCCPEAGRGTLSFRSHASGEAQHGTMHGRRVTWAWLARRGANAAAGLLGGRGCGLGAGGQRTSSSL